ncbi:hypothetical protein M422DRAFT_273993 [Sphaerobolus stellatus SS14]|uniref:Uncharacterized protein n=1 Tax=Sphaerobolus stellatus (strain SS14) TaxID=990650 RepID=A0A0C9T7R8_SPHS4|nr:hypothetical protein M422DRAFT_273993 [Sphaerobolus stellatus SS14]
MRSSSSPIISSPLNRFAGPSVHFFNDPSTEPSEDLPPSEVAPADMMDVDDPEAMDDREATPTARVYNGCCSTPSPHATSEHPEDPFALMSELSVLNSPEKEGKGRPKGTKKLERRRMARMTPRSRLKRQQKVDSERKARSSKKKAEKRHREKEEKKAAEKEKKEQMELVRVENETVRIQAVLGAMKEHGFKTVWQFCETFLATKHPQLSSQVTQLIRDHHPEIQHALARRDPVQHSELAIETVKGVIQSEIAALAELLRRQEKTAVSDILDAFSEIRLESGLGSAASIEETAPMLVEMLRESVLSKAKLAIIEDGKDLRRDHNIIIYTICCMLAFTRKEKASNLQLVIGLYLLASGARKNLVDVLAHAGLTLSYRSIIRQVKNLSEEATANIGRIFREQMCGIVWDNLNIAFRVGEQRTNN